MIPSYELQLGSTRLDPSQAEDVESIDTRLSLDAPADSLETVLRPSPQLLNVRSPDPVSVSLGYGSTLNAVFSGFVDSVEVGISNLRILGLGPMAKLLKLRLNQTYLRQSAGDIVRDLCSRAQVSVGDAQDGVSIPTFYVSYEVPAYEYIKELAERSGFDVYLTPENRLNFKPYRPGQTHNLEYGLNVIGVESVHTSPPEAVKVFGESPSSSRGADTTYWLTKDDVEGTAGTGQALLFFDPTVRDRSTADSVARSRLSEARNLLRVAIVALGSPDVKLGDGVSLRGFDSELLEGEFKVRTVEHSLNRRSGFTTRISCSREV